MMLDDTLRKKKTRFLVLHYFTFNRTNAKLLTLCEGVELAEDLPQRVDGLGETVHHGHPHAEDADEEVGECQVHQIQVDGGPHRPVEGHSEDDADIADQSDHQDDHVQDDLDVFRPGQGLR